MEDDDQVRVQDASKTHTHAHTLSDRVWFFWVGPGTGTGAHFCVPASQRQELQTPVEVRRGESRLLPAASANHWKEQPQRLHATRVPLQIQVEMDSGITVNF